jgi:hypothetical protein
VGPWILGALVVIAGVALTLAIQRKQAATVGTVATQRQAVAPPPPAKPLDQTAMLTSLPAASPAIAPPVASTLPPGPKSSTSARSKDAPVSASKSRRSPPSASAGRWQLLDPKFGIPVEP